MVCYYVYYTTVTHRSCGLSSVDGEAMWCSYYIMLSPAHCRFIGTRVTVCSFQCPLIYAFIQKARQFKNPIGAASVLSEMAHEPVKVDSGLPEVVAANLPQLYVGGFPYLSYMPIR